MHNSASTKQPVLPTPHLHLIEPPTYHIPKTPQTIIKTPDSFNITLHYTSYKRSSCTELMICP